MISFPGCDFDTDVIKDRSSEGMILWRSCTLQQGARRSEGGWTLRAETALIGQGSAF